MKTSIKLLASAFLLTFTLSSSALADDHSQKKVFNAVVYPAADASKIWISLEKYQKENAISLELVDEQGKVLFQETVSHKKSKDQSYHQRFDISELKDGNYTFHISSDSQKETISFKLTTPAQEAPNRFVAIN